MSALEHPDTAHPPEPVRESWIIQVLERLDNLFHVFVAILFVLMAASVLIHTSVVFSRQIPLIIPRQPAVEHNSTEPLAKEIPVPPGARTAEENARVANVDPFLHNSLEILSSILFVVIILELLKTILTYLLTHNIQAIMQEFIVVGIISSVRKILLVGAESSLAGSKGMEFIQEATGTLLSIGGILVLILGLMLLQRAFGKKETEPQG
jgi:uncharacterized membrane protein (DUF373 family)